MGSPPSPLGSCASLVVHSGPSGVVVAVGHPSGHAAALELPHEFQTPAAQPPRSGPEAEWSELHRAAMNGNNCVAGAAQVWLAGGPWSALGGCDVVAGIGRGLGARRTQPLRIRPELGSVRAAVEASRVDPLAPRFWLLTSAGWAILVECAPDVERLRMLRSVHTGVAVPHASHGPASPTLLAGEVSVGGRDCLAICGRLAGGGDGRAAALPDTVRLIDLAEPGSGRSVAEARVGGLCDLGLLRSAGQQPAGRAVSLPDDAAVGLAMAVVRLVPTESAVPPPGPPVWAVLALPVVRAADRAGAVRLAIGPDSGPDASGALGSVALLAASPVRRDGGGVGYWRSRSAVRSACADVAAADGRSAEELAAKAAIRAAGWAGAPLRGAARASAPPQLGAAAEAATDAGRGAAGAKRPREEPGLPHDSPCLVVSLRCPAPPTSVPQSGGGDAAGLARMGQVADSALAACRARCAAHAKRAAEATAVISSARSRLAALRARSGVSLASAAARSGPLGLPCLPGLRAGHASQGPVPGAAGRGLATVAAQRVGCEPAFAPATAAAGRARVSASGVAAATLRVRAAPLPAPARCQERWVLAFGRRRRQTDGGTSAGSAGEGEGEGGDGFAVPQPVQLRLQLRRAPTAKLGAVDAVGTDVPSVAAQVLAAASLGGESAAFPAEGPVPLLRGAAAGQRRGATVTLGGWSAEAVAEAAGALASATPAGLVWEGVPAASDSSSAVAPWDAARCRLSDAAGYALTALGLSVHARRVAVAAGLSLEELHALAASLEAVGGHDGCWRGSSSSSSSAGLLPATSQASGSEGQPLLAGATSATAADGSVDACLDRVLRCLESAAGTGGPRLATGELAAAASAASSAAPSRSSSESSGRGTAAAAIRRLRAAAAAAEAPSVLLEDLRAMSLEPEPGVAAGLSLLAAAEGADVAVMALRQPSTATA